MTTLTITKTGRVQLDKPVRVSGISLKSMTLYMTVYNLAETSTYTARGRTITIPPGYYTYKQLQSLFPSGTFKVHQNTLKLTTTGTITGGLAKVIEDDYIYLTPLCLYAYVEGIDTSKNLVDGKRSDLLSVIPVGKTDVKEIIEYQPLNNYRRMYDGEINSLNVLIRDEQGNDYSGRFVAEISLQ